MAAEMPALPLLVEWLIVGTGWRNLLSRNKKNSGCALLAGVDLIPTSGDLLLNFDKMGMRTKLSCLGAPAETIDVLGGNSTLEFFGSY